MRLIVLLLLAALLALPAAAQQPPGLYNLPGAQVVPSRSGTLAFTPRGRLLVVNPFGASVGVLNPVTRTLEAEIPVGQGPRAVALNADSTRALVSNYASGTVTLLDVPNAQPLTEIAVGPLPWGVVVDARGVGYVALYGGAAIARVDLATGTLLEPIATPEQPAALALWGDYLYVSHFYSGTLSLIYLPQARTVATLALDGALLASIEIDPRAALAYVPATRLNDRLPGAAPDNRAVPIIEQIDLRLFRVLPEARLLLPVADRAANLPFAARLNAQRTRLLLAYAGSDAAAELDLRAGTAAARFAVGAVPQDLIFSRDASAIYVHNALDQTLSVIDARFYIPLDAVPTSSAALPPALQIGARLFHSATDARLSAAPSLSCATCHYGGLPDGRTWLGLNTPLLAAADFSGWRGEFALDDHLRTFTGGAGLSDALDMALLVEYLRGLPLLPAATEDMAQQQHGAALFAELGCAACHAGPSGTDGELRDLGAGPLRPPPLLGLAYSAPYLHDGSAATLRDLFLIGLAHHRLPAELGAAELDALIAYLRGRG